MKRIVLLMAVFAAVAVQLRAQTIATFNFHRLGSIEIELFDDKPITVSNFLKYAASGRFENQIIHRWVPGFVIQGGGYRVNTSDPQQYEIERVQIFGTITNETRVGTFRSNTFGTIAMARMGNETNSASSQWFINLDDDNGRPVAEGGSNLDNASGGYTVFGRVISNANVLNLFVPPPPVNGIHIREDIIPLSPMAVLTTNELSWNDLVYVDLSFRREMNLQATRNIRGIRQIAWSSVAGVTNSVDYSANLTNWVNFTNVVGTGAQMQFTDSSTDAQRFYRVKLLY
jgi:cyclophilin family peptidyl-prolyl cis-trans isomerase